MTEEKTARLFWHVAPVLGVPTIFASVEYPRDKPPTELVIDGTRFEAVGDSDGDGEHGTEHD